MTTITTRYGQKISLERANDADSSYVLTLANDDGEILAQIGMEPQEYYELIDGVDS